MCYVRDVDIDYLEKDRCIKAIIIQCVSDEYIEYIKDETKTF